MKYIDRVLGKNEEIVHETGLHWIIFVAPFTLVIFGMVALRFVDWDAAGTTTAAAVIGTVLCAFGIFLLVRSFIDFWTTEIAVTTHRVVYKRGLIARDTIEISLNRVEGLDVKQTIPGRILNFGTVLGV